MLKLRNQRLIQMTPFSYMITLPKILVNNWRLKKGSWLELEINDEGELLVKPRK